MAFRRVRSPPPRPIEQLNEAVAAEGGTDLPLRRLRGLHRGCGGDRGVRFHR